VRRYVWAPPRPLATVEHDGKPTTTRKKVTAVYQPSQLTLALARARTNELLAEAEATRLATTAKRAQAGYSEGEKAILTRFANRARKLRRDINHALATGTFMAL
jgi:hypothetical protein